jgi:hypothetical protein
MSVQSVIVGLADPVMFSNHLNIRVEILWAVCVLGRVLIGLEKSKIKGMRSRVNFGTALNNGLKRWHQGCVILL